MITRFRSPPPWRLWAAAPLLLSACIGTIGGDEGADGSNTGDAASAVCSAPDARLWKLTPRQYERTLRTLLPDAPSATAQLETLLSLGERRFSNEATHGDEMTLPYVSALFSGAEAIGELVETDPAVLSPCLGDAERTDRCVAEALHDLLARAYRRPPTDAEVEELGRFVDTQRAELGLEAALGSAMAHVAMSPYFIYRTELGAEGGEEEAAMTPSEIASSLSYFLLDGPPDAVLRAAAEDGELTTPAGRAVAVRRLVRDPREAPGLMRFFTEYLGVQVLGQVSKDEARYPDFDAHLASEMQQELSHFVEHVLAEDDRRFETLMTANYSVASPRLAALYGLEPHEEGWQRVAFDPDERAGVLTQPAVLAAHSGFDGGDPVRRGLFILENILCMHAPSAPPDIPPVPEDPGSEFTTRERLAAHTVDPACRGCHETMDPLGLPFERYDAVGRFRLEENGKTIDPSDSFDRLSEPLAYADAIEMVNALAQTPEAQRCFVASAFHYAYGRAPSKADACEMAALEASFAATRGDIVELFVSIVSSNHFITRRRTP